MITEQDITDCKNGIRKDLFIVQLFPNLNHRNRDEDAENTHKGKCYLWCQSNIGRHGDKWRGDGVTVFSFRIVFASEEDVIMFMLANNL